MIVSSMTSTVSPLDCFFEDLDALVFAEAFLAAGFVSDLPDAFVVLFLVEEVPAALFAVDDFAVPLPAADVFFVLDVVFFEVDPFLAGVAFAGSSFLALADFVDFASDFFVSAFPAADFEAAVVFFEVLDDLVVFANVFFAVDADFEDVLDADDFVALVFVLEAAAVFPVVFFTAPDAAFDLVEVERAVVLELAEAGCFFFVSCLVEDSADVVVSFFSEVEAVLATYSPFVSNNI